MILLIERSSAISNLGLDGLTNKERATRKAAISSIHDTLDSHASLPMRQPRGINTKTESMSSEGIQMSESVAWILQIGPPRSPTPKTQNPSRQARKTAKCSATIEAQASNRIKTLMPLPPSSSFANPAQTGTATTVPAEIRATPSNDADVKRRELHTTHYHPAAAQ